MDRIAIAAPTADRIAAFKTAAAEFGGKVRVRKLSGSLRNAIRVVLEDGDFSDIILAAAASNAISTAFREPTDLEFRHSFDGHQINLYFRA